ncbi:MAG TPA: hypothetical protein VFS43_35405 [Polyangiaceae bacterium]|nr:hypothetical protein [Polyangiaceae bacterium]
MTTLPPTDLLASPARRRSFARRYRRRLLALALPASLAGFWVALHRFPSFASFVVDGVRSLVGPGPIAWLEDRAYGLQDRLDRWRHQGAPPVQYWEPPPAAASGHAAPAAAPAPGEPDAPSPAPFEPPYRNVAAPGDGRWVAVADPQQPGRPSGLFKALVHPDPRRGYAVLALVAIDLARVRLHVVPGTKEPESGELPRSRRPGLVDPAHHATLLAGFNGGFQAIHGHWGMMVEGTTLLPPRPQACTVAAYRDGRVRVGVWKRLAETEPEMAFYRQTPPCLVEDGVVNPSASESNPNWGATVDGETIIRRSALGAEATGRFAIYGMGDGLSTLTLARGMLAAGARDVAQLDVNHSYPRFFFYEVAPAEAPKVRQTLVPINDWRPDEYVGRRSWRDFFYLTKRLEGPPPAFSAAPPPPAPSASPPPAAP